MRILPAQSIEKSDSWSVYLYRISILNIYIEDKPHSNIDKELPGFDSLRIAGSLPFYIERACGVLSGRFDSFRIGCNLKSGGNTKHVRFNSKVIGCGCRGSRKHEQQHCFGLQSGRSRYFWIRILLAKPRFLEGHSIV